MRSLLLLFLMGVFAVVTVWDVDIGILIRKISMEEIIVVGTILITIRVKGAGV